MASADLIPSTLLRRKAVAYVHRSTQSQVMTNYIDNLSWPSPITRTPWFFLLSRFRVRRTSSSICS